MKKIIALIGLVVICFAPYAVARASNGFIIESFKSDLEILADGRLKVKETILVNFTESLHGIYRDLPITYQSNDGSLHYTSIEVQAVSDGSDAIEYEVINNGSNLRLKIGQANVLVSGNKLYVIDYVVSGVISSLVDYDELYWNVTGNGWQVPIQSVSASVSVPTGSILQASCYEGAYGSTELCDASYNGQVASFNSKRPLASAEGMTIAAGFPKNTVPILSVAPPPDIFDSNSMIYASFGFLIVFITALIIIFRLWWLKGRDAYYERKSLHDPLALEKTLPLFGSYEPIVPEYESPAKLLPGELGVLMDEEVGATDVSATIVDLAVRGYLTIAELPISDLVSKFTNIIEGNFFKKFDYLLKKTTKDYSGLLSYEKKILEEIFSEREEVKVSDLKDNFVSSLKAIRKSLYSEVVNKKLFYDDPDEVRNKYRGIGVGIMVIAFILMIVGLIIVDQIFLFNINLFWGLFGSVVACLLSGLILIVWAGSMPKRTAYGRELYRQALGYKIFVSGTEKYRQPFFEQKNIFMEILPYAMIFGVTNKLAMAMKEMGLEANANWYIGATAFNIQGFVHNISAFSNTLSTSLSSTPGGSGGSGGGGFSGGGFGGGGGGGW